MNFLLDQVEKVAVLRLKEPRLDSMIAPDLKAQLLILMNEDQNEKVLVNLGDVEYADSSGLGALLFGLRLSRDQEIQFALCGAQKRVKSLMQIAHLTEVLPSYETEEEAIQSLQE
jgi:anti-anti-sigma factor